jgi:hypothetical protein
MERNDQWLEGGDASMSFLSLTVLIDSQTTEPALQLGRSSSLSSMAVSNLDESRSNIKERSLSDSLLLSSSPARPSRREQRNMRNLPYESTVPIVYLMDSLRVEIQEMQEVQQRRSIVSQLLDTALGTVGDSRRALETAGDSRRAPSTPDQMNLRVSRSRMIQENEAVVVGENETTEDTTETMEREQWEL